MSNPVPLPARPPVDPFEAVDVDLDLLAVLDPADQVPVFGRVHAALTSALAVTAGTTSPAAPGSSRDAGGHPAGPGRPAGPAQAYRGGR